jgi:uncharacterized FAD-dependent dehydrogenase
MVKIGIIGGGISGIMAAYALAKNPEVEVIIFEQGKDITARECPILSKKVDRCINCKNCGIMQGMAGAGAFSDGKYNITTEFGGWLQNIVGHETTTKYIEKADSILVAFGATKDRFPPNDGLKKLCLQYDLHMLQSQCKHLGTDANFKTMALLVNYLKRCDNVTIMTETKVTRVDIFDDSNSKGIEYIKSNGEIGGATVHKVIFAVGRVGSKFFSDWCNINKVIQFNNQVDVGVRVELPALIWEDFEKKIYEPKILYRTKQYGDTTRMFCFNGRGEVVTENTNGVITVNGHAYKAEEKKTKNTNFALLSTINFTQPFNQPIEYARDIASLANKVSGGSVIVQTLGDLERGRRTDESRLKKSRTIPTLKAAVAGDLSLCMPKRQLDNIIETLHALDKIAAGTANYDTLLYGVECKYYSARPLTDDKFEIKVNNIENSKSGCYAIGDGAGFTRSLAQAAAQGLMVADNILQEI